MPTTPHHHSDRNNDRRHRLLPVPRRLPDIDARHLHRAIDCGAAVQGPYKKRVHRRQWRALARYMAFVLMLMLASTGIMFGM